MKKLFFIIGLMMSCPVMSQYRSEVWVSDEGNGMYKNPVLYADYSDPDVCVVGDDYFLTASSFNCAPGLPILHSRDLVNWKIVNYALLNMEKGYGLLPYDSIREYIIFIGEIRILEFSW